MGVGGMSGVKHCKRNRDTSKETCKRDLRKRPAKETAKHHKRSAKETTRRLKRPAKETRKNHQVTMGVGSMSGVRHCKRDQDISKETCKRDLQKRLRCIKRQRDLQKTLIAYGNRCAVSCRALQKRPMYIKRDQCVSKETNVYQKRPLYIKRD